MKYMHTIFTPTCFGSQLPSSGSNTHNLLSLMPNEAILSVNSNDIT